MAIKTDVWRPWLIVLAAIAGLSYASFPLGLLLNPDHALLGLVSFLSQSDQPYNWVFDVLDIVSACLSVFVLLVAAAKYSIKSRLYLWALALAVTNSVGTLAAALVPLPDKFDDMSIAAVLEAGDIQVIIHGVASFINSAAFVVAALLWAWAWRHKPGRYWRGGLAVSMLLLSTVGFMIGEWVPATSPAIQRLFIASYAVWFVAFVLDITAHVRKQKIKNSADLKHRKK